MSEIAPDILKECEKYKLAGVVDPGRAYEVCTGCSHSSRPHPAPTLVNNWRHQMGLSILPHAELCGSDAPQPIIPAQVIPPGPKGVGTHLTLIFQSFGEYQKVGCTCSELAARMNELGPDGCRKEFDDLAAKLREQAKQLNWWATLRIARRAIKTGMAFKCSPRGLLAEAIRRAEEEAKTWVPPA